MAIPKVREGSHFPDFLIEPRRRAERAVVSAVTEAYVLGISTRKVDKLVKAMGMEGISRSRVSEMAKSLDETVESFRSRPLDAGPYPLRLDAMQIKSREGGRVVNRLAGWLLALPMVLFEGMGGKEALHASERATEGQRRRIALWLVGSS